MTNKFTEACDRIRPLLPENVRKIFFSDNYSDEVLNKFSEDNLMIILNAWLNSNLKPSSTDPTSVAVYAALYDYPEWVIKQVFEENGL